MSVVHGARQTLLSGPAIEGEVVAVGPGGHQGSADSASSSQHLQECVRTALVYVLAQQRQQSEQQQREAQQRVLRAVARVMSGHQRTYLAAAGRGECGI